jgi:hypothetical protein
MKGIADYDSVIKQLFADASTEVSCFPAPLNEIGLALLAKFKPAQGGAGTNYISYLLPFWLKEQTASPNELCRDLAIGNLYAMVHFFVLDDVMDEDAGLNKLETRHSLVLGQLFQTLFHQRYRRHFSADSPLWMFYRDYTSDWALAVSQEGKGPADPYDPGQLARKSAPVKLCAAGLLLLSGQQERISDLEEAIDLVLATLQLSDDWADWRDDLAEENCSAFLTLVRKRLALPSEQPLDERLVKQAIYRANCLDSLSDITQDYGERLKGIPNVPAVLIAFHDAISDGIRRDAIAAKETTNKLASSGGLTYFLSNYIKN